MLAPSYAPKTGTYRVDEVDDGAVGAVLGGIERHRLVVAVHGVASAKREGRRDCGVGSEQLERAADNGCGAHTDRGNAAGTEHGTI